MTATEKLAYSIPETAKLLGVCKTTVLNMCLRNDEYRLPHIRVGIKDGRIIIPAKALYEYLEQASLKPKSADEIAHYPSQAGNRKEGATMAFPLNTEESETRVEQL